MPAFTIAIPDDELADLKARLRATRFPRTLDNVGWDYGIDDSFLRRFVTYWAEAFDWRLAEARLNRFAHFIEPIGGEQVHFIHARGRGETNVPLLLTNGWPSNFVELLPLIPLLTEPVDGVAFDVVIPSLPGYGFSGQPTRPGMHMSATAPLWAELMTRLGYPRFLASGSDMGGGVVMGLVRLFPERLIGAHYINVYHGFPRPDDPTPEEQDWLERIDQWSMREGAYGMVHGTKPATLAVGLNDSPAGLAAWILEKYHAWGDTGGSVENAFDLETLATIVTIYWFTQTIGSSMRLYKEAFADADLIAPVPKHDVPHGIIAMLDEDPAPRAWGERHLRNIVRWTELRQGGHFPALEVPEEMAHDIRAFHRQIA